MSVPPPPGLFHGAAAMVRLQWKRLVRGRKLRLGAIAVVLVVAVATAARYLGEGAEAAEVMQATTRWGFFSLLVFLLPFLFHAGSVAEEVEGRTLTYLTSRPAGRLAITLGKYAAGTVMTLGLLVGGLILVHLLVFVSEPDAMHEALPGTGRALGALTLLGLYYGGVCMFWGALVPQAAGILATLHLAALEFTFTWAPGVLRLVSMNHHARTVAQLEMGGFMVEHVPTLPSGATATVVALAAAAAVAASAVVVGTSEYRHARA
jgi:ABC-2 type transport system permease protein